jgi:hypothetical protein
MLAIAAVGAAAALTGAVTTASAAPPAFCERYAHEAVRQNDVARSHPRCADRLRDPVRWQSDYRRHYDWCRNVSEAEANRETAIRNDVLRECMRERRGGY